ncbi:MAG: endonuclease/exonuclease/phosphatase family protein [Phycisphaerales bacterium]
MRSSRVVAGVLVSGMVAGSVQAQLRIVQWNVTNYSSGRVADFQNAIYGSFNGRSMNPDVIIAEEIVGSSGAVNFRNMLNTRAGGPTDWQFAAFADFPGDTDNALFYRASRVSVLEVVTLDAGTGSGAGQPPRPNERYRVRLAGYASAGAEMYLYAAHMKAGSTGGDRDRRTPEAQRLRDDAEMLPAGSHFILGGDFNMQSWTEPAYQVLVSSMANNAGRFIDPIKSPGAVTTPGSWNGNSAYRIVHTQDPATCDAACGSGCNGGGMDDRHDQLLISAGFADGNGLEYIGNVNATFSTSTWDDPNHSYRTWGNDGSSFNCRLNTASNQMVGNLIAQSLVTAANGLGHLPVLLDVQVPAKVSSVSFIDFGSVGVGTVATRPLSVANGVNVALWSRDGNGTGIDDLDYTLSATGGFSAPGGMFSAAAAVPGNVHTITMPTGTPGMQAGTVTINSDDPDQPAWVVVVVGMVEEAACACDWDQSGSLGSQDFFDFLADFFEGNGDFNHSGATTSQDFFDFLVCFLGGC